MNEEIKIDFEVREGNFENAIIEVKEKLIVSQHKTIEEHDEKLCLLVSTESENITLPCSQLRKQKLDDMFRMKSTRRCSMKNLQVKTIDILWLKHVKAASNQYLIDHSSILN